jgi:hypothetical protein
MITIVFVIALILLAGPLRPWALRNWFVLASVVAGAIGGLVLGSLVVAKLNCPVAGLPLIFAIVVAIGAGQKSLSISRDSQRRNRNGRNP